MADTNSNPTHHYDLIDRHSIYDTVRDWAKHPNLKPNDYTGSILATMEAR